MASRVQRTGDVASSFDRAAGSSAPPARPSQTGAPLPRLLDPKLDVVFKMMFARAGSRDILVALLAAVLKPPSPIVEVMVQNAEVPHASLLAEKDIALDLVVRLGDGSVVDVEMQTHPRPGAMARVLYYWARLASAELQLGESYGKLPRVVMVWLLGYRAFPSTPFHGVFQVLERTTGTRLSDRLEIHTVELPRIAELGADERAAEQALERWARFFTAADLHELEELATMDPIMARAKSILEELSGEPSAQEAARQRELGWLNWSHSLYVAREEGEAIGLEKGTAIGRQEGEAIGRKEGEALGLEKGQAIGRQEGEALGLARGIVAVLASRGIYLDEETEARIEGCRDLAQLERWLSRATVVSTVEGLFVH